MVKATQRTCAKCKYAIRVDSRVACNYIGVTKKSRIFVDGKKAYDPEYCDKYETGKRLKASNVAYTKKGIELNDEYQARSKDGI